MAAVNINLHMNVGDGENSYAKNSLVQTEVMSKAWPVVEEAIKDLYCTSFPNCIALADLGCSSGPNTLFLVSNILDTIHEACQATNHNPPPEIQVFLNDLPGTDFNTLFKSLPAFYEKVKREKGESFGPVLVSGLPGSFYGRLFPSNSLHFLHSSNSLHWLSKIPEGITNHGKIKVTRTSLPDVYKAYLEQFERDFSLFLSLRSKELCSGGRMVISFDGHNSQDPTFFEWECLAHSLADLLSEGHVEKAQVDSFNIPYFSPHKDEVEALIKKNGCFKVEKVEVTSFYWDPVNKNDKESGFDKFRSARIVTGCIRAVAEPMLTHHFGGAIIERLFERFEELAAEMMSVEMPKFSIITLSATRE